MNSSDILSRAASLICGPGAYSAKASEAACVATTRTFNASGALERAARPLRSGAALLGASHMEALSEAKAAVCRVVGFPHLDLWEWVERPNWSDVRRAFRDAAA